MPHSVSIEIYKSPMSNLVLMNYSDALKSPDVDWTPEDFVCNGYFVMNVNYFGNINLTADPVEVLNQRGYKSYLDKDKYVYHTNLDNRYKTKPIRRNDGTFKVSVPTKNV